MNDDITIKVVFSEMENNPFPIEIWEHEDHHDPDMIVSIPEAKALAAQLWEAIGKHPTCAKCNTVLTDSTGRHNIAEDDDPQTSHRVFSESVVCSACLHNWSRRNT